MLHECCRRMILPVVVICIVGSVYAAAQSRELTAEVQKGTWAPLPLLHPEKLPDFINDSRRQANAAGDTSGDASVVDPSLQQVFLKDDKIVSVR